MQRRYGYKDHRGTHMGIASIAHGMQPLGPHGIRFVGRPAPTLTSANLHKVDTTSGGNMMTSSCTMLLWLHTLQTRCWHLHNIPPVVQDAAQLNTTGTQDGSQA